jgi:uncharacterized repeat protein (TIGR01451 family)
MTMDRKLLFVVPLLLCVAASSLNAADPGKPDRAAPGAGGATAKLIRLKSEAFAPAGDVGGNLARVRARHANRAVVHVIVQFDELPDQARRAQLEGKGVRLLGYLPDNSYFASVPARVQGADLQAAGMRWAGAIYGADKTSESIRTHGFGAWALRAGDRVDVRVSCFADADLGDVSAAIAALGGETLSTAEELHRITASIPTAVFDQVTGLDDVRWVEEVPPPPKRSNDGSRLNVQADVVQAAPYNLTGNGVALGIWDGGSVDQFHDDFAGRITIGQPSTVDDHATHVAGTMAGSGALSASRGGSPNQWRGMAPGARIISYDFNGDVITEHNTPINTHGIVLSQNSWGFVIDSFFFDNCYLYGDYSSLAPDFDEIVTGVYGRGISVIFAAGNDRSSGDCGLNNGPPNYVNYRSLGPPATAKNIIAVGAINSDNSTITEFSSWGPVDDGRVKPDLVAPGCEANGEGFIKSALPGDSYGNSLFCGTSMAAPAVSGVIALLTEDYRALYGTNPLPSTIKGLLLHTAEDMDDGTSWFNQGPDYASGYGRLQAQAAVDHLRTSGFLIGAIGHGETNSYVFNLPAGSTEVKLTLVWDDPAGQPNAAIALVNDLDLVVFDPNNARKYPWTLNPANPGAPAVRTAEDHLNVVEQVYVDAAVVGGGWRVSVGGRNIPTGRQGYTLVYSIPQPVIAAVSQVLVAETCGNGNNAADPHETVTMDFALRNVGALATTDLVATLLPSANVLLPSPPQLIGVLAAQGGIETNRFTFKTAGQCGTIIPIRFQLQDGANDLGVVTFNLRLGTERYGLSEGFENDPPGNLPLGWTASVTGTAAAWTVAGNGADGSTNAVFCPNPASASDNRLTSPTIYINSPQAQLSFRHSYNTHTADRGTLEIAINGGPFTNILAVGGSFAAGAYSGSGWSGNSQGYITTIVNLPGTLAGQTVQFQWRFTSDAVTGGVGWYVDSIFLRDGYECCNPDGLSVGVAVWPTPVLVDSNLTYTVTVLNSSSAPATGVKLTNTLGSTLTFLSATPSQGSCSQSGNEVTCDLGGLAAGASATITILTRGNVVGSVTNVARVYGNEVDAEPLDNTLVTITEIFSAYVPDLVVVDTVGPMVGSTGGSVLLTNEVRNVGSSNAVLTFRIAFYLSTDQTITTNDIFLGSRSIFGLAAGQSTIGSTPGNVPLETDPGVYYLGAIVDFNEQVVELNESNNAFIAGTMQVVLGPDMTIASISGPATASIGGTVTLSNIVQNIGTGNPSYFNVGLYLSTDATITTNDIRVGVQQINGLVPGGSFTGSVVVAISPTTTAGLYYLGAIADFTENIAEANETNNWRVGLQIDVRPGLDLAMIAVSGPTNGATGNSISITNIVANLGSNNAGAFSMGFYLSPDSTIGTNDQRIGTRNITSLGFGQRVTNVTAVTIPLTNLAGTYYLGSIADYANTLPEITETNNMLAGNAIEIVIGPDLTMTSLRGPLRGSPGGTMQVTNVVANLGPGNSGAFTIGLYLSTDNIITTNDLRIGTRAVSTLPGMTNSTSVTAIALSVTFTNFGVFYLGAIADYLRVVPEISETNNALASTNTIEISNGYDFTVAEVSSPTNAYTGGVLNISNIVENVGIDNGPASVLGFYISTDPVIGTNDIRIGTRNIPALNVGQRNTNITAITIPVTNAPGIYYLGAIADYTGALPELAEGNNARAGNQIMLQIGPDLQPLLISGPALVGQSATYQVTTVIKNNGAGNPGSFNAGIYLSTDTDITTNDYLIGVRGFGSGIAPGLSSTGVTAVIIASGLPSGTYYWGVVADHLGTAVETNENNNAKAGAAVEVRPQIDLVVSHISGPLNHCTGNPFIITNVVSNIGVAASPRFNVGLYISTDDIITIDDELMATRTINSLGVGQSNSNLTTLISIGNLPAGRYYFGAIVDDGLAVTEISEVNNARVSVNPHDVTVGPDLVVNDIICPAFASQGTTIPVTSFIYNQGCGNAPVSFSAAVYLSTDPVITTSDTRLGSRNINTLGYGLVSTGTVSVALSTTLPSATYYIGVIADDANRIYESVETNNALLGTPVVIRPAADLIVMYVSGPTNVCTGNNVNFEAIIMNQGTDPAGAFQTAIYLSSDTNITTADLRLINRPLSALAPGQTNSLLFSVGIPLTMAPGTYFVGAIADYAAAFPESDETNNAAVGNLIEVAIGPEFVMSEVTGPSTGAQGSSITITNVVSHVGCGDAPAASVGLYLSPDANITTADTRIGTRGVPAMLAGTTSTGYTTVTLSATLASGVYYLGAIADYANGVIEVNDTNNHLTTMTITIEPGIDLVADSVQGPAGAATGTSINVTNLIRNAGTAGLGTFTAGIFVSTDGTIAASNDVRIGTATINGLAAGQSTTNVASVVVPNTVSAGTYYLGIIADDAGAFPESNEANNSVAGNLITITPGPDLIITGVSGLTSARVGATITVTSIVQNIGIGQVNTAFRVGIYISPDSQITTNDTLLNFRNVNTLGVGQTNSAGLSLQIPSTLGAGTYYIGAYADYQVRVEETDESNNTFLGYTLQLLPLRIVSARIETNDVVITFETVTGRNYRLQKADTIGGPWTTVTGANSLAGSGTTVTFRDVGAVPAGRRVYRVQLL